jgi:3-phenylpropionate/cinnamic acid dioxygenase small subunit
MTDTKRSKVAPPASHAVVDRQVSADTHYAIEQFLFREAALLDGRQFDEWLRLLSEDVHYRIAARVIRDASAESVHYDVLDDDAAALKRRVDQIGNPRLTHAENPPTFTRRFVSNVRATERSAGSYDVASYVLLYRHRLETPEGGIYACERQDVLHQHHDGFRLAQRYVRVDQAAFAGSLSVLF